MIDTPSKRCAALATRRLPWFRRFLPLPDVGVLTADRQQVVWVYRGIAVLAPQHGPVWAIAGAVTPIGWAVAGNVGPD